MNATEPTPTYLVPIEDILKAIRAEGTLDPEYTWTARTMTEMLLDLDEPVYIFNGVRLVDETVGEKLAAHLRDFLLPAEAPAAPAGPKFPDVTVQLTGEDGNAFAIIGAVSKAMKRAGHGDAVSEFTTEAMSGDYDNLLQTAIRWVDVQ